MTSEPKKYQQALEFAPTLLGLSYTLISYISALGAHRTDCQTINHQIDFAAVFFKQAKQVADLLNRMATSPIEITRSIAGIEQQLHSFEAKYQTEMDEQHAMLLQQLRLIVQLLPQMSTFVSIEKSYHQDKALTSGQI